MSAFASREIIRNAAQSDNFVESEVDRLVSTARPAIWLRHDNPQKDSSVPVGASKVGGEPDLPVDLVWPMRAPLADAGGAARMMRKHSEDSFPEHRKLIDFVIRHLNFEFPMAFMAQIDLATMSKEQGFDPVLPDHGHLWIFNDAMNQEYGELPPGGGTKILWSESTVLSRRRTPEAVVNAWQRGLHDFGFAPDSCSHVGLAQRRSISTALHRECANLLILTNTSSR